MGLETAALAVAGLGALTATTQIAAGNAAAKSAKRQGEYNAQVYEQQATMVQAQKKLQEAQDNRRIARTRASVVSRTAGKGLMLSGSPLAVMADIETQMEFDKRISQYNYDVQSQYLKSGDDAYRFQGREQARLAKTQGYSNAFSTILRTAGSAYSLGV